MGRFPPSRLTVVSCVASVCGALSLPASGAERVGAAAAVRGIVQLAAISGVREVGKKIASGEPIFLGDRISTGPRGRLQIMLLDETVFTIGPEAAIVIDEFVYDPSTSKGKVAATMLKGTFRFVTGKVSKRDPRNMVVKLPVGSIGVRGTIVAGRVEGGVSTILLLGPGPRTNTGERIGRVIVSTRPTGGATHSVEIRRPGFATIISGDKPPTPPALVAGLLTAITGELAPPPPSSPEDGEKEGPVLADEGPIDGGSGPGDGPCCQLPPPPKPPIMLGPDTTFEQLRSINSGTANFGSQTRPITGGGLGSYTISYSYNFGTQSATGNVSITTTSGFTAIGTAGFPLLANPFASGTGPVNITENSIALGGALTGGIANITYKFRNSDNVIFKALDHQIDYTHGVTGTGGGVLVRP